MFRKHGFQLEQVEGKLAQQEGLLSAPVRHVTDHITHPIQGDGVMSSRQHHAVMLEFEIRGFLMITARVSWRQKLSNTDFQRSACRPQNCPTSK